jgi:hypothetical protein
MIFYSKFKADAAVPQRKFRFERPNPALDDTVVGGETVYGSDHLMAMGISILVIAQVIKIVQQSIVEKEKGGAELFLGLRFHVLTDIWNILLKTYGRRLLFFPCEFC